MSLLKKFDSTTPSKEP
jgi:hypothetical protein